MPAMLPLILTDRHGETYAIFRADDHIPFDYYPADLDRRFNWAERFVMSFSRVELGRLEAYAGPRTSSGIDPLVALFERRRLLVYRKDTSKDDKLAIEVLRNSIREVLDQLLAGERREAEAIAREHEQRNALEKAAAYKQAFDQGVTEGARSLLKFFKEVNDVVSPMLLLARAGQSAWDAAEGGLEGWAGRFSKNMSAARYREIVEALDFDPGKIDQKTLYQAFDIAQTVWEDEETQAMLTRFARELAAAQHGLEWAHMAGARPSGWP